MNVTVCRDDGSYDAGSQLKAGWRVGRVELDDLQSVEISVLWHTVGKGDEDLDVHHFQRFDQSDLQRIGIGEKQQIQCVLPASPLSYQGHLIQIHWKIRVRVFLTDGREIVAEQPFYVVARRPDPAVESSMEQELEEPRMDPPQRKSFAARLPQALKKLRRGRLRS